MPLPSIPPPAPILGQTYNQDTRTTTFLGEVFTDPDNQSNMSTVLLGSSTTSKRNTNASTSNTSAAIY